VLEWFYSGTGCRYHLHPYCVRTRTHAGGLLYNFLWILTHLNFQCLFWSLPSVMTWIKSWLYHLFTEAPSYFFIKLVQKGHVDSTLPVTFYLFLWDEEVDNPVVNCCFLRCWTVVYCWIVGRMYDGPNLLNLLLFGHTWKLSTILLNLYVYCWAVKFSQIYMVYIHYFLDYLLLPSSTSSTGFCMLFFSHQKEFPSSTSRNLHAVV
jgi:hypothetical protein